MQLQKQGVLLLPCILTFAQYSPHTHRHAITKQGMSCTASLTIARYSPFTRAAMQNSDITKQTPLTIARYSPFARAAMWPLKKMGTLPTRPNRCHASSTKIISSWARPTANTGMSTFPPRCTHCSTCTEQQHQQMSRVCLHSIRALQHLPPCCTHTLQAEHLHRAAALANERLSAFDQLLHKHCNTFPPRCAQQHQHREAAVVNEQACIHSYQQGKSR